ncbi:MAG: RNase adapter RapZ [Pseudomonadota bacterium]
MQNKNLLFITGLSGAGMSSTLKALEDISYEVFDNFPLSLLPSLLEEKSDKPIALGIDTRTRHFDPKKLIQSVDNNKAYLLFLDCDQQEIQKRFSETRRVHPMAADRTVLDGIEYEKQWLEPLIDRADLVINTTNLSIHDLRQQIESEFEASQKQKLNISLVSFGYKNGIPREADIIMDVRFLKNPHWVKELKPLTGQDEKVADYIRTDENFSVFFKNFKKTVEPLLPAYQNEGKSYLTIAIGCTGGKHRSVFTIEELSKWLKTIGYDAYLKHRDKPNN